MTSKRDEREVAEVTKQLITMSLLAWIFRGELRVVVETDSLLTEMHKEREEHNWIQFR